MTTPMNNKRKRIPSETIFLPVAKAMWAQTDPERPDAKFDPENPKWSIRLEWEGEDRKAVEQLLGPYPPRFLELKREELMEEAAGNAIKLKRLTDGDDKVEALDYELPWREVQNRETAEPTGAIDIVVSRNAFRIDRITKRKVPNKPPLVVDALKQPINEPIPNGAKVIVKMATWPVYHAKDNVVGMKRLLEAVQVVEMPTARAPDASGFEEYDDGYKAGADRPAEGGGAGSVSSGADY